jgi:hypothetical protein
MKTPACRQGSRDRPSSGSAGQGPHGFRLAFTIIHDGLINREPPQDFPHILGYRPDGRFDIGHSGIKATDLNFKPVHPRSEPNDPGFEPGYSGFKRYQPPSETLFEGGNVRRKLPDVRFDFSVVLLTHVLRRCEPLFQQRNPALKIKDIRHSKPSS